MREHPNPEKIREVFTQLRDFVKSTSNNKVYNCNMEVGSIGTCGTAVCHGGWLAALALHNKELEIEFWPDGDGSDDDIYTDFSEGAEWVSGKLFEEASFDAGYLACWAKLNPALWGNNLGEHMFGTSTLAFNKKPNAKISIDVICDHWLAVADRIEEKENL